MVFEILSSLFMAGLAGYTYLSQSGATNDAAKIQRICTSCGLVVKERGRTLTIQLLRKTKIEGGTEYAYRIPLGLSFADFENKKTHLQDGLNNKRTVLDVSLNDLKEIDWRGNIIEQIRSLFEKKKQIRKEIEMEYDGLLRIRVYDEPLTDFYCFDEHVLERCKGWEVPIGVSRHGFVTHDFDRIPHMIVAGTTRYGKSVFLKNVITTLIHNQPQHVRFTLIDLKGGLTFNRFKNVSQVQTVAKDVDETMKALEAIRKEMNERMALFLERGYEDVREAGFKERHFIVIDEAAQLASAGETGRETKQKKIECEKIVAEISRVGGALGYRLVFATQYPTADTLPRQVKQNCDAKLCFKLQTAIASQVVLDEEGAEKLPLVKGRAIYLTYRKRVVQTPYIENEFIEKVIRPHIVMKPRKEERQREEKRQQGGTRGSHTLILEKA